MPSKTKKKRPAKRVASQKQLELWEDRVMDAEDAQDDAYEAAKTVKRLLRFVVIDSDRRYLEESLLGPLEAAAVACDSLIDRMRDRLKKAREG